MQQRLQGPQLDRPVWSEVECVKVGLTIGRMFVRDIPQTVPLFLDIFCVFTRISLLCEEFFEGGMECSHVGVAYANMRWRARNCF